MSRTKVKVALVALGSAGVALLGPAGIIGGLPWM